MASVIVVTFLLVPVRTLLRRILPGASQQSHALVTACLLVALVTVFTVTGSESTFLTGRLSFWATWVLYALTLTASLFWPLAAEGKVTRD